MFEVIPAIDLRGGVCVRLLQGDYARETQYSSDPVEVARRWQKLGARRLHVVDLDGARAGVPIHHSVMAEICLALDIEVEVSGGLRTLDAITAAINYGASRVQLGSSAVKNPGLVQRACREFPGRIVVGIDARQGEVMTDGWTENSGVSALDLARSMVDLGVPRIMVTDIGQDGMMAGPNVPFLQTFVEALRVPVVASGGVTTLDHLRRLADAGCEGAIVGKALYEGAFDLSVAIAAFADDVPA
jgi:phosphoribosylformimino-5-aminoimidazole carboxamide ribotide isomerase